MLMVTQLAGFGAGASEPDTTAPTILSNATKRIYGDAQIDYVVTCDEPVTLVLGGADAAHFRIQNNTPAAASHNIYWQGPTPVYASPVDADSNNIYEFTVTATDPSDNASTPQNVSLTVVYDWNTIDPFTHSTVKLLVGFSGTANDESTGGAHGAPTGTVTIGSGFFAWGGSGATLNGTSNSVRWATSADWNIGSGSFTIDAYISTNGSTGADQFIISQWGSTAGNYGWVLKLNSSLQPVWAVSVDGTAILTDITGSALTAGTKYLLSVDYDGSKYRMYVDGIMVGSSVTARTVFNPSQSLCIGSDAANSANWFAGGIDEVRYRKGIAQWAYDGGYMYPPGNWPRV